MILMPSPTTDPTVRPEIQRVDVAIFQSAYTDHGLQGVVLPGIRRTHRDMRVAFDLGWTRWSLFPNDLYIHRGIYVLFLSMQRPQILFLLTNHLPCIFFKWTQDLQLGGHIDSLPDIVVHEWNPSQL